MRNEAAVLEEKTASLLTSFQACRETTRAHARSFYFASFALPKEKREAAYAVYAFCRYADDIVDEATASDDVGAALDRLDADLEQLATGSLDSKPFGRAFAWAVRRYDLKKVHFMELLEGVGRDRGMVRMRDWEELRDYCYHVASVVGLIMAKIMGLRDPAGELCATDLGLAMQLTNIARDVAEDWDMDRVYLPATELEEFGVKERDLEERRMTSAMRDLIRFQVERAREYYLRSESGIRMLADDGSQFSVWLMRHVYAGILDEIEAADYDVFRHRAKVSFPGKCLLALRAWRDARRARI